MRSLAGVYLRLQKEDEAKALISDSLLYKPWNQWANFYMGRILYFKDREFDNAKTFFFKSVTKNEHNRRYFDKSLCGLGYFMLGMSYSFNLINLFSLSAKLENDIAGNLTQSREYFDKAIKVNPTKAFYYEAFGRILVQHQKYEEGNTVL